MLLIIMKQLQHLRKKKEMFVLMPKINAYQDTNFMLLSAINRKNITESWFGNQYIHPGDFQVQL